MTISTTLVNAQRLHSSFSFCEHLVFCFLLILVLFLSVINISPRLLISPSSF